MMSFVLTAALTYDEKSWNKVMETETTAAALDAAIERLAAVGEWTAVAIEAELRAMLGELEINARKGLQPVRVATTGSTVSPPLFETLEVLGRDITLDRLRSARARL
jgi:glutamyl-tRNA synthetase